MKGNKFLAAVLAASMAFSAVPVTALSTFAATPIIADGSGITAGNITGVYYGITKDAILSKFRVMDSNNASAMTAATVGNSTAPSISKDAGGNYTVNYGTVTGTITKDSTAYNYSVDADVLDAQTGANLARDLIKAYLTDKNVKAETVTVQNAIADFKSTTDTTYSTARDTLNTAGNYANAITPNTTYEAELDNGSIKVTATVAGQEASYSIPVADALPDNNSTVDASSIIIEDAKDSKTLIEEFETEYSKNHKGVTYSNAAVSKYTKSSHGNGNGSMNIKVTLTNASGDKSTCTFENIVLKHGVKTVKEEAEEIVNKELKAYSKNSYAALAATHNKIDKTHLAAAIVSDLETKLGKDNSSAPYTEMVQGNDTDDPDKVAVEITDYTPATATSEGSVSGKVTLTYNYAMYMQDGTFATGATDIDPSYDDISEYQSVLPFSFSIDELDEVDATAIKKIDATRTYTKDDKTEATLNLGSTSINLIARGTEVFGANAAASKIKYATLTAALTPAGANTYTINWSSANEKVATVTVDKNDAATAVVTGLTKGKTTIKADLVDADGNVISSKKISVEVTGFQFDDVQDTNKFYYTPVYNLYDAGIVAGTSATTFSPKRTVTRAEFVQMLYAASGKTVTAESKFSDVVGNAWYAAAVTWAVNNNITAGTDTNTFSPNKTITRAEAMTMLYAAYGHGKTYNATHAFTDVKDTAYYKEAVNWAVYNSVTAGTTGTTFGSNDPCDRGQAATFIDIARNK